MAAAKVADAVAEQKVAKAQQLQAVAAHYKQLAEEAAAEADEAVDASDAAEQKIYDVITNAAGGMSASFTSARPATQNQHGQQRSAEDTLEEDSLIAGNQSIGSDNTAAIMQAVAQHGIGAGVEISVNSHSSAEASNSSAIHAQAAATIEAVRADLVRRHEGTQRAGAEIQHAMPTALELLPPPLQPEPAEEARSVAEPLTSFLPRYVLRSADTMPEHAPAFDVTTARNAARQLVLWSQKQEQSNGHCMRSSGICGSTLLVAPVSKLVNIWWALLS